MNLEYYKAYDKRYKQLHEKNLSWETDTQTIIIEEMLKKFSITKNDSILEIGCGEGRDSKNILNKGYNLLATDVSNEAINYCKLIDEKHCDNYKVLDVLDCDTFKNKYKFIYSIACLHMLVLDTDRKKYFDFINKHLDDNGFALILTMGNGKMESSSNINNAWEDIERIHQSTGEKINVATTSCRIVNFETLKKETNNSNLLIIEMGITQIIPNFPEIMYIVVKTK